MKSFLIPHLQVAYSNDANFLIAIFLVLRQKYP